ncbi:MAG: twin-arginine translocase TatA/TatE family subunit [Schleiferiaceae bacterium]
MTDLFLFFNLGGGEIILIVLVIIMVFGADKIPEIARGLGKGINNVKNATNELKREITESADNNEDLKNLKDGLKEGKETVEEITGAIKRNTKI